MCARCLLLLFMTAALMNLRLGTASQYRGKPSFLRLASSVVPDQPLSGSSNSPYEKWNGYSQPLTKEGAYDVAAAGSQMPVIILVNPFLDQNVGSVSRAMLNFGMVELRVVDPNCDILSEQALALAAGSADILRNAKVFGTLSEAIADLQRVMATTIRPRHMTQVVYTPAAAAKEAMQTPSASGDTISAAIKTGILFGRERSGLTNDEVAMADSIITINTFKQFSSLNLAQAVNIIGYEMWKRKIELENNNVQPDAWLHPKDNNYTRLARREELESFFSRLEGKLNERSFQVNENRRDICYRNIRNIFQRVLITKSEIDLLQGVLSSLAESQIKESK